MNNPSFPLKDSTGTRWANAAPKRTLKPLVRKPDMRVKREPLFDRHPWIMFVLFGAGLAIVCVSFFAAVMP